MVKKHSYLRKSTREGALCWKLRTNARKNATWKFVPLLELLSKICDGYPQIRNCSRCPVPRLEGGEGIHSQNQSGKTVDRLRSQRDWTFWNTISIWQHHWLLRPLVCIMGMLFPFPIQRDYIMRSPRFRGGSLIPPAPPPPQSNCTESNISDILNQRRTWRRPNDDGEWGMRSWVVCG